MDEATRKQVQDGMMLTVYDLMKAQFLIGLLGPVRGELEDGTEAAKVLELAWRCIEEAKEATGELTTLAIGLTKEEAEADGSAVTAAWDKAARRMRKWEKKAVRDDLAELSAGQDDDADKLSEEEWRLRKSKKAKRDAEFVHVAEEAVRTVEVMLSKGVKAEDIVRRLEEWKREPGRKGRG